jgi:Tol biopolymer transport system component/DNA-binding winged helix-turn-helix (wHTH) protein
MKHDLLGFGGFEVDLRAQSLRRRGRKLRLGGQPFQVLALLLEKPGEVVTRDEFRQRLWSSDTFVDFDNGINIAIKSLRQALGDSAENPKFIETLPRVGYRFLPPVERGEAEPSPQAVEDNRPPLRPVVSISQGLGESPRRNAVHAVGASAVAAAPEPYPRKIKDDSPALPAAEHVEMPPAAAADSQSGEPAHNWRRLAVLIACITTFALLAALLLIRLRSPSPPPKVLRLTQLTYTGRVEPYIRILNDGARLYFLQRYGGKWSLMQVSVRGGDPVPLTTPFPFTNLFDISPDKTELLIGGSSEPVQEEPAWIMPVTGGPPRRLGDVAAHDAACSPDGRQIVYARADRLYLISREGNDSRELVRAQDIPTLVRWSPSGRTIRFTVTDSKTSFNSLWEVSVDGTGLHRLLPGWNTNLVNFGDGDLGGEWTRDGKYFFFRSSRGGSGSSLWALREDARGVWPRRPNAPPLLLYTGLSPFWDTSPSFDGKRIYAVSQDESRELVRYDVRLRRFVSYMSGTPARYLSFSRDGEWVAYSSTADYSLWRSKVDGTNRPQLTFPPLRPGLAQWSPDGSRIAFGALTPGNPTQLYLVSRDGGKPQELVSSSAEDYAPCFLPDGSTIAFVRATPGESALYLLTLKTREVRKLRGSEGMGHVACSPDGRYAAALPAGSRRLLLFDFRTERWAEVGAASAIYGLYWSADSQRLYFQDLLQGREQPIYRLRLRDRKIEQVATSARFERADFKGYSLTGLTPDESPLASLIRTTSDIHALEVELP